MLPVSRRCCVLALKWTKPNRSSVSICRFSHLFSKSKSGNFLFRRNTIIDGDKKACRHLNTLQAMQVIKFGVIARVS